MSWEVAGAFAASLTAVVLVCASAPTLYLLLSMTQHAPDWFCLVKFNLLAVIDISAECSLCRLDVGRKRIAR